MKFCKLSVPRIQNNKSVSVIFCTKKPELETITSLVGFSPLRTPAGNRVVQICAKSFIPWEGSELGDPIEACHPPEISSSLLPTKTALQYNSYDERRQSAAAGQRNGPQVSPIVEYVENFDFGDIKCVTDIALRRLHDGSKSRMCSRSYIHTSLNNLIYAFRTPL